MARTTLPNTPIVRKGLGVLYSHLRGDPAIDRNGSGDEASGRAVIALNAAPTYRARLPKETFRYGMYTFVGFDLDYSPIDGTSVEQLYEQESATYRRGLPYFGILIEEGKDENIAWFLVNNSKRAV